MKSYLLFFKRRFSYNLFMVFKIEKLAPEFFVNTKTRFVIVVAVADAVAAVIVTVVYLFRR